MTRDAEHTPSPQSVVVPVELMTLSLKAAEQFIVNGIETGYVRLPDYDDDPAHSTLPLIRDALALLSVAPAPSSLAGGEVHDAISLEVRMAMQDEMMASDANGGRVLQRIERANRAADAILAAISPEALAGEGEGGAVHYGDPCIRCGVGHDDVPPGPCRGDGITISRERACAVLDYLKNGRGPAGWPTQLWVEVQHFIANIEAALSPEAPAGEGVKACADFQEAIDYFEADVADALAEDSERADLWDREVTVNIDALKTVMRAALTPRHEAPAAFHDRFGAPAGPVPPKRPEAPAEGAGKAMDAGFEAWLNERNLLPNGAWDWPSIVAMLNHHEDALCARSSAPEAIKAAYKRGWNDREDDIIERAERIAPEARS